MQNKIEEGKIVEVEGKKIFKTRDLHLASALLVQKFELTGIDVEYVGAANRPVGFFSFVHTPLLEAEQRRWILDKVFVASRSYDNAVRTLKSLVTSAISDLESHQ